MISVPTNISRYEVKAEQAQADVERLLKELVDEKLIWKPMVWQMVIRGSARQGEARDVWLHP